jgi:hypothetical protein
VYLSPLAPPHKLLPYPCPICGEKFGTAQLVVLNGILRHGIKHPYFNFDLRNYENEKIFFIKSIQSGNGWHGCYKNTLLFRIYHYSSEKYDNVKKQMKPIWKNPRKIKKAYGREVHSFRTRYEITADYKSDTKIHRIPMQDIFLDPHHFHLKENQRSQSWSLNEKTANDKKGWLKELYEMIKQDGWYLL